MTSKLKPVLELLEQNELQQALETCLLITKQDPTDADAMHLLGIIYAKLGKLSSAIESFNIAIKLDPQQALYHNNISNAYKLIGNLDFAIRHLHQALQLAPNSAEAYNNLGSMYYSQGRIEDAIPQFEKAIRLNPNIWEAHYNLANCYIKEDKINQAISHYQTVLKLYPQHLNAKTNLAMSLVSVNDFMTALPLLEEIAPLNPQHAEIQGHLANAYLQLGHSAEAITQFNKALALSPERPEWQHNLAVLYLRDQQPEKARQHFQITLELQPDNETARHMLDSLTGKSEVPASAPASYVSGLFDQYAEYYNEHMTKELNYNVPVLLRQTISKFISSSSKQLQILDLGCGTGLCGVYLRDIARLLFGVDISPVMLEQARNLGAYDALCCCNILEAIPGFNQNYFDIIVAADVFVYIGNLAPLFAMLASAIKPQGKLLFTIEEQSQNDSFILQTTGRYAHSQQYIDALCKEYGFLIEINESITPRIQRDKPVTGRLYALTLA